MNRSRGPIDLMVAKFQIAELVVFRSCILRLGYHYKATQDQTLSNSVMIIPGNDSSDLNYHH